MLKIFTLTIISEIINDTYASVYFLFLFLRRVTLILLFSKQNKTKKLAVLVCIRLNLHVAEGDRSPVLKT